ncbi:MAG: hypothetical protein AAGA67_13875, partial [Cyanobacteria bacterium P01_F01_bin.153]
VKGPISIENFETSSARRVALKVNFQNLVVGLIVGSVIGLLVGLLASLVVEFEGLQRFLGLFGGLFGGLLGALSNAKITTGNRDDQGILQPLTNAAVGALVLALFGIASPVAEHFTAVGRESAFPGASLVAFAVFMAYQIYLIQGGNTDRQIALRFTLCLFGYSPWNYRRFLRYCTDRGFLQQVGGGYRFVHALLRDHFADTVPCPGDPNAPSTR